MTLPLPPEFWQNERKYLAAVLRPRLQTLAMIGAMEAVRRLDGMGLYVDDSLINEDAARWASQHTDDLLIQLGTTSERLIGNIVSDWIKTPGATVGNLEDLLRPVLDDNQIRAARTAITETTRAAAEGNNIAHVRAGAAPAAYVPPSHPGCFCALLLKRYNNTWLQVWSTNNDDKVCRTKLVTPWGIVEGCRALHGVCVSEGEYLGKKVA